MDKKKRMARRKRSIRKNVFGTVDRPRLTVHRSNKVIYAQIVNDMESRTICGVSTGRSEIADDGSAKTRTNVVYAKKLGEQIAKAALEKGIKKVVFDRSGYKYHGGIKALADGAREAGLEF